MLQQTTVAAVRGYFAAFLARWPTVEALAAAPDAEVMAAWAGLGYYARARNLHRLRPWVADATAAAAFPTPRTALRELPGVGPYTAAAIAAIAFEPPAVVVDGNVERVMARLFAVEEPLPAAKPELRALAARLTPADRPGDYAQALMDLGATVCTPRAPACGICPWMEPAPAAGSGSPPRSPAATTSRRSRSATAPPGSRSAPTAACSWRPARPQGSSAACSASPAMPGARAPPPRPPFAADWRDLGEVRHTLTHFHLVLRLKGARLPAGTPAPFGEWRAAGPLVREVPSVMRKALRLGLPELGWRDRPPGGRFG